MTQNKIRIIDIQNALNKHLNKKIFEKRILESPGKTWEKFYPIQWNEKDTRLK